MATLDEIKAQGNQATPLIVDTMDLGDKPVIELNNADFNNDQYYLNSQQLNILKDCIQSNSDFNIKFNKDSKSYAYIHVCIDNYVYERQIPGISASDYVKKYCSNCFISGSISSSSSPVVYNVIKIDDTGSVEIVKMNISQ